MSRGISTVFVALSKLPGVWGTWYPLVHPVVSVAILNESIHSKATKRYYYYYYYCGGHATSLPSVSQ